jgi:hypothetical protein
MIHEIRTLDCKGMRIVNKVCGWSDIAPSSLCMPVLLCIGCNKLKCNNTLVSCTESYRDLQESYLAIQLRYRTRKFELECSMSAPVRSSVHRNGTYPTLKPFLRFLNYQSFVKLNEHILIFRFMCADHAARYCKSAGNNPERSGTQGMEKILAKMEKV